MSSSPPKVHARRPAEPVDHPQPLRLLERRPTVFDSSATDPWFVSLDLEMTGVDQENDEIIEIGAIRFTTDGKREEFQTLVNPGRPLPYRIQALTGITDEELQSAPPLAVVSRSLLEFIGSAPVIGQHVAFDLLYLAREDIRPQGPVFNTAEIAKLLFPGSTEYTLRTLANRLGVDFPVQHRALPDAEAALAVFLKLRQAAANVDPLILAEIVQLIAQSTWPLRFFFRDVERSLPSRALEPPAAGVVLDVQMPLVKASAGALTPLANRQHISPEEIAGVFDEVKRHPAAYSGFEQRPQQVEMAQASATALDSDTHLLVEAGTGTGKSLAYLLPAACFALRNNERVVISTSTIGLQEQIIGKDIPALLQLLAECGPSDIQAGLSSFRAVALKGRGNYICLQKFAQFRRQPALTTEEARFAVKLLLWLRVTETGDRAELTLRQDEDPLWARVSAANVNCFAGPSYYVRNGTCQLMRARKRAEGAHLVVVNHALLLSDISAGGRVLPGYERLIVDEAHNLEAEATSQFGFQTGQAEVRNALSAIHERAADRDQGLVATVRLAMHGEQDSLRQKEFIGGLLDAVAAASDRARERVPELFERLQAFVHSHGEAGGDYDNRLLITPGKRAQPEWQNVDLAWENLRIALDLVIDGLSRLATGIGDNSAGTLVSHENLGAQVQQQMQDLVRLTRGIDAVLLRHDEERIAWLTVNRQFGSITIASAPLNVGEVLESYLFGRKSSVILTSATLSAGGSFRYVRERLGLEDVEELALGSPFDYKRAALVLLPSDMPEPNRLDYQPALEAGIVDLARASEGRALVLFTSHAALRATYYAIKGMLAADGISVLAQGIDGAPDDLLEALRTDHKSVLLGTSSFWEGVDVVGEALSLLIIAKLPFSVPTDPVFAARSELFDDPFKEFALPQSVLRFKQGFGRLIRHRNDRGALVVLDRRIRSKQYGRTFLQSLPDCSMTEAPIAQLPSLVRRWLQAAKR
jgi:predicted DnaQ family exonuclease/DinG family helicase